MPSPVVAAAVALREVLVGFDPDVYSGADCVQLAEELAATEKACAGARLLAGSRAVAAGGHQESGKKDGPSWLAVQTGTTSTQARQGLDTASRLTDCTDTKAALLSGRISVAAATEITQTEVEAPGAEAFLLPHALTSDLTTLREKAREYRQHKLKPEDLHQQQRKARFFRHWKDRLGMICFSGALPPEAGLPLVRRIELAACRARREARKAALTEGSPFPREPFAAYAADGLVAVTAADPIAKRSDNTELVIVCDINAWRRGHPHEGEVCHIIDGGPIPVDLAKELSRDAFLSAVFHDGVQIQTVKRFGRYLPVELRTALDLGPVPEFTGRQCVDCGERWGLQYDHVDPVANHGPTCYDNLKARCWTDHQIKTEKDRQAGLLGPNAPPAPSSRSSARGP